MDNNTPDTNIPAAPKPKRGVAFRHAQGACLGAAIGALTPLITYAALDYVGLSLFIAEALNFKKFALSTAGATVVGAVIGGAIGTAADPEAEKKKWTEVVRDSKPPQPRTLGEAVEGIPFDAKHFAEYERAACSAKDAAPAR